MASDMYTTTVADSCTSPALSPKIEQGSSCSRPTAGYLSAAFHTYTASTTSAASDASSDLCSDDDTGSHSGGLVNFFRSKLPASLTRQRADSHRGSDCRSRTSSHSTDTGDELSPSSPPAWSVDGTSSDSELSDDQASPEPFLVYSVAVLLRLRAAAVCQQASTSGRPSSVLGYTVRDAANFPDLVPSASPTAKAAPSPSSASSSPCSSPCSSPSSWAAQRHAAKAVQRGEAGAGEADDAKIVRTARSILNKLTVEKFDSLYEQLATSGIRTMSHIQCLMQEVFEKATVQHHFIPMYADLCMRLEADPRIDEEAKLVRKQRALGNVKFVGQLVARGMLSSRLLVHCAGDLLRARASCGEALESLAAFLTVAAPTFDLAREYPYRAQLDSIFQQVSELTKDKSVAPRERFLLRDVLELRDAGWHGRTCAAKPAAPMRQAGAASSKASAPRSGHAKAQQQQQPPQKMHKPQQQPKSQPQQVQQQRQQQQQQPKPE
eukprot:CAMPEP_0115188516 /NCGR_PEP_ID=MMETSP0270-20121206/11050_1 /TAXON_ID=71861 /ORGANISM="Scrippsiella trochoidea, Strain CCMP3099" /LENGTH=492 /DNA_ID=CAMNT_0002601699 /DNA_START=10 /DNA_END=1486 /DNA_ORIENTATION=-